MAFWGSAAWAVRISAGSKSPPSSQPRLGLPQDGPSFQESIFELVERDDLPSGAFGSLDYFRRWEWFGIGLNQAEENVYTYFPDPRRDEWETKTLPILKRIPPAVLARLTGKSQTTIKQTLAGRRPHRKNQELLVAIIRDSSFRKLL